MDVLWSPWRYDYITKGTVPILEGCAFCGILHNSASDDDNFILHRAEFNFVILNIYPYTSGHLMVVPYAHLDGPDIAERCSTNEMMDLVNRSVTAIKSVYRPDGVNLGMNLGKAAGAGVAEHYHMHVLPRWVGDVNFMTAIGQTRTIPEALTSTFEKLRNKFGE
ncbi:MAG TPA: HIT domain-containing protein [Pyrinomonadaceae bacterium]|nr:HIT domain-containing protein [Chloracidobacterium sp.]MBP9934690.1 HIT domain-containing protein [Pyrinomonadaceae bacterium]MBK9439071.1 HIT domain-containing protein [Chloracidobacterium sp.]MBL0240524.1 HIT domain-containing protein [Chloracidobacterium sp.]HQX55198.1 HIT domain-containing protein [Pyrinomonadaceae bacterium]